MIRHAVVVESKLAPAAAKAAFLGWVQSIGYRPSSPAFLSAVDLERGSLGHNVVTVNPQQWRATLTAKFDADGGDGSRTELEWKIVTAGQVVTRVDVEYWRYEVAQATAVLEGKPADAKGLEERRKGAMSGNVWRALVLTLVSLGPLIASIFLYELRLPLYLMTVVFGAATYLAFRSPRRL